MATLLWILLLNRIHGRLVVLKNGRYDNMPIDTVTATKKVINVKEHYSIERLRPGLPKLRNEAAVLDDQRTQLAPSFAIVTLRERLLRAPTLFRHAGLTHFSPTAWVGHFGKDLWPQALRRFRV